MIIVQGIHNSAVCHTDTLEKSVAGQIKAACDEPALGVLRWGVLRLYPEVALTTEGIHKLAMDDDYEEVTAAAVIVP